MKISEITVKVVGPPVERHGWAHDLVDQYMTATYIIIKMDNGIAGIGCATSFTSYGFGGSGRDYARNAVLGL